MNKNFFSRGILMVLAALLLSSGVPEARAQGCASDITGDGQVNGADLASLLADWGSCPGEVISVTPLQGSFLGGTLVTIVGVSLDSTISVKVGGVACTSLQVLSPTLIKAVTPAGAVGEAAIAVTTASGTTLAPTAFAYVQTSIASVTPNTGSVVGGTAVTISGLYMNGVSTVTFGGVPATNVVAVNSTTVTAVTPAGSVSVVDVVLNGAKGTATASGGFTYSLTPWATVLEATPSAAVVTDANLRNAIIATGLPWRVRDNASNIEMLLVPPGTFTMGCSASVSYGCGTNENPTHQVTLTNAFYLGRYEVTQAQWLAEMGSNPSFYVGYTDSPSRPVEQVSWSAIQPFLIQNGLRLPTEAEWEYAYRAGTTTAFHNGSNSDTTVGTIGWFQSNSGIQTHAVGGKLANALGMHDIAGNVFEWVNDWYGGSYYSSSPSTNPLGPATGANRVLRGGDFNGISGVLRASHRLAYIPSHVTNYDGFRAARSP